MDLTRIGGQAKAWLVKEQDLGIGHQRPAYGQHLLFSSAQGSRHLFAPFLQAWKKLVNPLQALLDALGVGRRERSQNKIFLNGQGREDTATFRDSGVILCLTISCAGSLCRAVSRKKIVPPVMLTSPLMALSVC